MVARVAAGLIIVVLARVSVHEQAGATEVSSFIRALRRETTWKWQASTPPAYVITVRPHLRADLTQH
jgi:hypothetical protein